MCGVSMNSEDRTIPTPKKTPHTHSWVRPTAPPPQPTMTMYKSPIELLGRNLFIAVIIGIVIGLVIGSVIVVIGPIEISKTGISTEFVKRDRFIQNCLESERYSREECIQMSVLADE